MFIILLNNKFYLTINFNQMNQIQPMHQTNKQSLQGRQLYMFLAQKLAYCASE